MVIDREEFQKRIVEGVYEVLDIAKYDFGKIDEVVEKIKLLLEKEYKIQDTDLLDSHYAHARILLNIADEWDNVEENLDLIIKEVLDKTYLDRESRLIEEGVIRILIEDFKKEEKTATELVLKEDIRKQIDDFSSLLHYTSMDWAISILTANEEYEIVEEYLSHYN